MVMRKMSSTPVSPTPSSWWRRTPSLPASLNKRKISWIQVGHTSISTSDADVDTKFVYLQNYSQVIPTYISLAQNFVNTVINQKIIPAAAVVAIYSYSFIKKSKGQLSVLNV